MQHRIKKDVQEFIDILRGRWRRDLMKFIERGDIKFLGPERGIAIPVELIRIPQLKFGKMISPNDPHANDEGKGAWNRSEDIDVEEGEGEVGADLGKMPGADGGDGDGKSERSAGRGRGIDTIEVEVPYTEFGELFREVLELPRIKPKGTKLVKTEDEAYTGVHRTGPDSLLIKKRTLRNTIRRQLTDGTYDPKNPILIPIRDDKRFRAAKKIVKPKNNAVIFFMMDVSGSMTPDDRRIVRYFCALCEFWLRCNYDNLEIVWIVHDDGADEVEKEVFFRTQRGGGTFISTAHELMIRIIHRGSKKGKSYPPEDWNIYPFYFSDGFNWGEDDETCKQLLQKKILPIVNQYVYGQVSASRDWWAYAREDKKAVKKFSPKGSFGQMLAKNFEKNELVVCIDLERPSEVPSAIRVAFGKGR